MWEQKVQTGTVSNQSYEVTRGKVEVTEAVRERMREALRVLERAPDDRYLIMAVKEARAMIDRGKLSGLEKRLAPHH
jgi:hypothetical protein